MQKDGMHTLQPTALAIKQAPNSSATVNTGAFPHELTVVLRHIPLPEHLAKNSGRSAFTTYHTYLVNSVLNTKAFLGPVSKLRPGTFQLIAENIPVGDWDQLVISLAHDNSGDLGIPVFTFSHNFHNPAHLPERYTTLPADFAHAAEDRPEETPRPKNKREHSFGRRSSSSAAASDNGPSGAGTVPSNENKSPIPAEEFLFKPDNDDESLLIQPGTVLPEKENYTGFPGISPTSPPTIAPMDCPEWFNLGTPTGEQSEQALVPITIEELPDHALWLVNYQGAQLVGYTFQPSDPKKPVFIVHGVPGSHSRRAKPKDQGYEYWVANPAEKGGYWLRYVNPYDNLIAYPFPITEDYRK